MQNLTNFFKNNAIAREDKVSIAISNRFLDDGGKPIEWVFKSLTPSKIDKIGLAPKEQRMLMMLEECVVFPDLKNADLQNSYGVYGVVELIDELLNPKEYGELVNVLIKINGLDKNINSMVDDVKNY